MKRRGFFKLLAGVLLAPLLPAPKPIPTVTVFRPDQIIVTIGGKGFSGEDWIITIPGEELK